MKKVLLIILAGIFGGSFSAKADVSRARSMSEAQKQQIAAAIKVLSDAKAISLNQNHCVQFDPDLISILESEGHLQRSYGGSGTVCIGRN